jgi:ankyrin repeat protein
MKALRWIEVLMVNGFKAGKISGLQQPTIILRRILAVALLFMFVGLLASYASDGLELIQAAEQGNIAKVKTLLAQKVDVNIKDIYGRTALMRASQNGHNEIVKILLAHGADVNAKNSKGITALMCAPKNKEGYEIVQLLKKAGAKE